MEVAARIPPRLRQSARRGKRLLRAAMETVLPEAILRRPKAGFCVPLRDWMAGALGAYADDVLRARRTVERGIFHAPGIERLLQQRRRFAVLSTHVWTLLVFELWCRAYLDEPSATASAVAFR